MLLNMVFFFFFEHSNLSHLQTWLHDRSKQKNVAPWGFSIFSLLSTFWVVLPPKSQSTTSHELTTIQGHICIALAKMEVCIFLLFCRILGMPFLTVPSTKNAFPWNCIKSIQNLYYSLRKTVSTINGKECWWKIETFFHSSFTKNALQEHAVNVNLIRKNKQQKI